jgi:hypothetical protein
LNPDDRWASKPDPDDRLEIRIREAGARLAIARDDLDAAIAGARRLGWTVRRIARASGIPVATLHVRLSNPGVHKPGGSRPC